MQMPGTLQNLRLYYNHQLFLKFILEERFFYFIKLIKILFFLPPPQIKISFKEFSLFNTNEINSAIILFAVKFVRVAAPS